MAKTNKLVRHIKTPAGMQMLPLREAQSKSTALYLLELRTRRLEASAPLPKRKFVVTIQHPDSASQLPRVIRIRHA